MADSTARAARFEGDATPAPAYLWAPPEKPLAVSIPLAMIDRLEKEAVESFRSLSSRGSEIGGLLFGTTAPGSPLTVAIESYEGVDCDYARGPLYRLADADLARIDRVIEQRLSAGLRPVGYYRSHTRKGICLDADDLALFDSRFRDTHHIVLLVRPNAIKASMAGIFFRENGKVHLEQSCLEFPFRSGQQPNDPLKKDLYDAAVAGPRSVNASPAPAPSAPKPAVRAQIVPIASRREVTPESPLPSNASTPEAVEPAPAAPPAGAPATPPPAAATPAPEPKAPPKPETKTTPAPEPKAAAAPEPKATAGPEPKSAPAPEPKAPPKPETKTAPAPAAAADAAVEPEAKKRPGKLVWILAGTAATLVLGAGILFTSGVLRPKAPIAGQQDTSALALRVDRNSGDIVLTWNRDSDAIKNARRAVLSISDGPQQENVAMDLAQLRNGSIVYSPVTSDVVFKMEVTGADEMKTTSESVRVLRTRPSPMSDPAAQQAQQTPSQPAAPTPKTEAVSTPSAEPTPAPAEEKVALAQPVRPFKAAPLANRLRPVSGSELPDAPLVAAANPSAPNVNLGSIVGNTAAPAPAPAQPAAPPAAPLAAEKKPALGGQVTQAQLIRRRDPEYPRLARNSGAGGVVELMATIKVDGTVGDVKVLRGHPLLRQAAVDAVKSWIYKPAVLNGTPIETQSQVLLNFQGGR